MQYSQQQIEQYISILKKYSEPKPKPKPKPECEHQLEDCKAGFVVCKKCASLIQKIEHTSSYNEFQRCHFKKKSVYDRKYHFENKIKYLIKKI